jgi:hypothetical protein
MSRSHKKTCRRPRTRNVAHVSNERTGVGARGVADRAASPAHAAVHAAPAVDSCMIDAFAVLGRLLRTLDPSVALQILTRAAAEGVAALLAIAERAKHAEELAAQEAHTRAVGGAGSSRRRSRSSRTASTP